MKIRLKSTHLQLFALSTGLLGFLLRVVLFTMGIDKKGLLTTGHWTRTGLLALSILTLCLLFISCRFLRLPRQEPPRLQALAAGWGCFLCAGGFLMTAIAERASHDVYPDAIGLVLYLLSAAALVFIGIHRCIRRSPHYLAHTVLCLTFAARMILQYRNWSSDPQLSDYCFHMLALVALMLTAFHSATYDENQAGYRKVWLFGLMGVFFALVSVWRNPSGLLMALCSLWILTNLPFFRPHPKKNPPDTP